MDVGAFMKALEYASGKKAQVIGKPSATYFTTVLEVSQRKKLIGSVSNTQSCLELVWCLILVQVMKIEELFTFAACLIIRETW